MKGPNDSDMEYPEDKNGYIKLVGDYQSKEGSNQRKSSINKRSSKKLQGYLEDDLREREYNGKIEKEKEGYYANKNYKGRASGGSLSNRKSYVNRDLNSEQSRDNIQDVLVNCQNEIMDLKDAVMESRMHIEMLQDQLNNEKKGTEELRSQLKKKSIQGERIDVSNLQSGSPPDVLNDENQEYSRESQNARKERKWLSFDSSAKAEEISIGNVLRSESKAFFHSNLKKYPKRRSSRENEKSSSLKQNSKSKNSMEFERSANNANQQCEYILEKIADMNKESNQKTKDHEMNKLKTEVKELKAQKNDMIETFQNIIQLLAETGRTSNKQEHHRLEVKKEFKKFKDELESKLNKADVGRVSCTLNFSPTKSSQLGKTTDKTQEEFHIPHYGFTSASRLPRPSSKGVDINSAHSQTSELKKSNNMSMETPPNQKAQKMRELWKSHIKDPLSNDKRYST